MSLGILLLFFLGNFVFLTRFEHLEGVKKILLGYDPDTQTGTKNRVNRKILRFT